MNIFEHLYAGKMHALLFRNWKTRVKGRDWYDFEWYVRHGVALDFAHLQIRTKEFNGMDMDKDAFAALLKERFLSTNIDMVKRDVLPFIQSPKELDIWSNEYFLQLADRIKFLYEVVSSQVTERITAKLPDENF